MYEGGVVTTVCATREGADAAARAMAQESLTRRSSYDPEASLEHSDETWWCGPEYVEVKAFEVTP